ncbi:MAG: hypothetical protein L0Y44_14355 [Phycisphaerales bacterium]|nr:hypothetical protein [Phycisphaerales bacterium]
MPIEKTSVLAMVVAGSMCGARIAPGQESGEPIEKEAGTAAKTEQGREVHFSAGIGTIYQFEADTEQGGEFSVSRYNASLILQTDLSDDLNMSLRFIYGVDAYDFEGAGGLGAPPVIGLPLNTVEPWEDIHILSLGAVFTWSATDRARIFAGPVAQISREFEADWDDGLIGGGVIGGSYTFDNGLTLGGGLVITTQIEDDVRVDPILILNYQVTDELRLVSQTTNALRLTGVELVYQSTKGLEFALGVANQFSRFRLDDDGVAPGGVGQDESLPFWFRATYDLSSTAKIDGIVGFNTLGEVRLEDANGNFIDEREYDATPFLGVFVNFTF